jgi:hypothetical protein
MDNLHPNQIRAQPSESIYTYTKLALESKAYLSMAVRVHQPLRLLRAVVLRGRGRVLSAPRHVPSPVPVIVPVPVRVPVVVRVAGAVALRRGIPETEHGTAPIDKALDRHSVVEAVIIRE